VAIGVVLPAVIASPGCGQRHLSPCAAAPCDGTPRSRGPGRRRARSRVVGRTSRDLGVRGNWRV